MIKINEKTKIATLLKGNPEALEVLVQLSPDFKKLKNPILRKLMAGRTNIAMAAKIGKCSPEDFYAALAPLGFIYEGEENENANEEKKKKAYMEFLIATKGKEEIYLDARPIINENADPLRIIQQYINKLTTNQYLKLKNSFEPIPLILLLKKQGVDAYVDAVNTDEFDTYFYKVRETEIQTEDIASVGIEDWDAIYEKNKENLLEIDVRHLEMPKPMMTILEHLEQLHDNQVLYVYHKKVPVFLLNELKDRGLEYRIKEVQEGEVYFMIFKEENKC